MQRSDIPSQKTNAWLVIWVIQKFETYLMGKEFVIQTDHQLLSCLKQSKIKKGHILRWAVILQPFRYQIEVIKGKENIGADFMNRSTQEEKKNKFCSKLRGV